MTQSDLKPKILRVQVIGKEEQGEQVISKVKILRNLVFRIWTISVKVIINIIILNFVKFYKVIEKQDAGTLSERCQ